MGGTYFSNSAQTASSLVETQLSMVSEIKV